MGIDNPHFFIVGCPRSGTTMLASLLDKHSKIAVPPETHYFIETVPKDYDSNIKFNHEELVNKLSKNMRIKDLEIDMKSFEIFFKAHYSSTYLDLFRALSDFYIQQKNKTIFGEKTPNHLLKVDQILNWYPNTKIILIVRDGRDTVLSLKKVPWIHNDVRKLSYLWKKRVQEGENILKKFPNNVYYIKYEDILLNPKLALINICRFLNIEFEEQQLSDNVVSSVMPTWEKSWKKNINKKISTQNISRWKALASRKEQCIMSFVMHRELKKNDYDLSDSTCLVKEQAVNFILHVFLGTKFLKILIKFKSVFRKLGFDYYSTKPTLEVDKYLKEKYSDK